MKLQLSFCQRETHDLLREVLRRLTSLETTTKDNMAKLDDALSTLLTAVQNDTTVEQSVLAYVQGVPALIQAAVADALAAGATPAQLQQITDAATTLTNNGAAIVAAIKANTPAGPPATAPPVTVP